MKNTFVVIFMLTLFISCKNEVKEKVVEKEEKTTKEIAPMSNDIMETAVIYEANIRQYSPEGTFDEFTKRKNTRIVKISIKETRFKPLEPNRLWCLSIRTER